MATLFSLSRPSRYYAEMHLFFQGVACTLLCFLFLLFLLFLPTVQAAPVQQKSLPLTLSTGWPQDSSDILPDPRVHYGQMENGLRYAILAHPEPKNRVGLYLNVQSGSLHERDQERGYAHYLEHMLFNGTTHYPPGTLVERLQHFGMGFGADTNASTGYDATTYKLLLATNTEEMLDEGLLILSDYAQGALLLETEIERERGIILAEKRARDSALARVRKQQLAFDFAGTLLAKRDPIGTEERILAADSTLLRAYYERWYVPANCMVIVVGDTDPKQAERLIHKHFSTFTAPQKATSLPDNVDYIDFGAVEEQGTAVLSIHEPDMGYTGISLGTVWNVFPQPETRTLARQDLHRYLAMIMLENRLQQRRHEEGAPLVGVSAYTGTFLQRLGYAQLFAKVKAEDWQRGLHILQYTLAQAVAQGFTETEFFRAKKEIQANLAKEVQTAATIDSRILARRLIRNLNTNRVTMSAEQELHLYGDMLNQMSLTDANRAFQQIWQHPRRLVEVVGTADIAAKAEKGSTPEQILLHAYEEIVKKNSGQSLQAWQTKKTVAFPYLPLPEQPAQIIDQQSYPDLHLSHYVLDSGVSVNLRPSDVEKNQVHLLVNFGGGKRAEPREGMALLAERVVNESGMGGLSREELDQALTGKNVGIRFSVGGESFSFSGTALGEELETLIQLAQTWLYDPAFRPEAYTRSMNQVKQEYEQMSSTVEGMQRIEGERFLSQGNTFYAMPRLSALQAHSLAAIEQWLRPSFAKAFVEINLVGDIDPQEALALLQKYFGSLPGKEAQQRQKEQEPPSGQIEFPAGQTETMVVHSAVEKTLLTIAWPTDDFWDISQTRRLSVLASVLDDRLRRKIREQLGATYSPQTYNRSSRIFPSYGVLRTQMIVDSHQAASLAERIKEVAAQLVAEGLDQEELDRALAPTLTSIRDYQRTNTYWLKSVLSLSTRYPEQLVWSRNFLQDYQAISIADINALARKYLQKDHAAILMVSSSPQGE